jgi:hypothetical protein
MQENGCCVMTGVFEVTRLGSQKGQSEEVKGMREAEGAMGVFSRSAI